MALIILGKSKCPLCGDVIAKGDELVATSHFIESPSHPLWRYSDAAMHEVCFQRWEYREAFVAEFNRTFGATVWGNGTRHIMAADGSISVVKASTA